jgi:nucleoid DNA-binding protein
MNLSVRDLGEVLDNLLQAIQEALAQGQEVRLPNIGRFKTIMSPERPGRNPKTGAITIIAAQKRVSFIPSLTLKRRLKAHFAAQERSGQDSAD